jgi:hypothetical protein
MNLSAWKLAKPQHRKNTHLRSLSNERIFNVSIAQFPDDGAWCMVHKEAPMSDESVLDVLAVLACNCMGRGELKMLCNKHLITREVEMLISERDRLRGSLAAYEAELARVERELSAKNI